MTRQGGHEDVLVKFTTTAECCERMEWKLAVDDTRVRGDVSGLGICLDGTFAAVDRPVACPATDCSNVEAREGPAAASSPGADEELTEGAGKASELVILSGIGRCAVGPRNIASI